MSKKIIEVIQQINNAHAALQTARNAIMRDVIVKRQAGRNVTEWACIEDRLNEAISLSDICRQYMHVLADLEAQQRLQQELDTYQGADEDGSVATVMSEREHRESMRTYNTYASIEDLLQLPQHDDDEDDDDWRTFYDDIPYLRFNDADADAADTDDEADECDAEYDDIVSQVTSSRPPIWSGTLGDERAAVAFDTTDTAWATQPLHEEEYRVLFGLRPTPGGDWHYDIFGNWYAGPYKPPTTDDPDYNAPW